METEGLKATEAECAAGRTAPRVSLLDIESAISAQYFVRGDEAIASLDPAAPVAPPLETLTLCLLVMNNGFVVLGKSAPASRANFDADLGRKLAYEDAIRQIWPLMGFSLRDRLAAT